MRPEVSYVDLGMVRIEDAIGPITPRQRANLRKAVSGLMEDIQHRLYQHAAAELLDLCEELSPKTKRGLR